MAPDSRFWRHQLGDATTSLRRTLLKASLVVILMVSLSTVEIQARTEPFGESPDAPSYALSLYDGLFPRSPGRLASLFPPESIPLIPPAGQRDNGTQIHIPNQPAVKQYICFFTGEGRPTFEDALERSQRHVPIMTEILEAHGVPADMISVVFVESCFRRYASYRGAVGYWQLLAATARAQGLRIDRWVDERKDPVRSTQAAAKYLRSLYDQFESWPLALAAYNAGDSYVASVMKRARTSDFWELSRRRTLPGITRAYVPKVLAAIQIMRDLEAHGFKYPQPFPRKDVEAIASGSPLRPERVAKWLKVPASYSKDLNFSLCLDRSSPDCGVNLNLHSGAGAKFELAYENRLRN